MLLLRLFLPILLALSPAPAAAQLATRTESARTTLDRAADELKRISRAVDQAGSGEDTAPLRERAVAVRGEAEAAVEQLTPELALIDARVAELGPRPATGEPADIAAQRQALARSRSETDGAIRRGRLLSVEAGQLADEISEAQAERFGARVSERVASPLSPGLWRDIWRDLPRDGRSVARFGADTWSRLGRVLRGRDAWPIFVGLAAALLLAFPLRVWLRRAGRRFAIERAPGSRARRTGLALWFLMVGTLTNGFAAAALVQGLRWAGALGPRADRLAGAFVSTAFVSAFIVALGGSLLLRKQASWRLLPIDDEAASRLRPYSWWAGLLTLAGTLLIVGNRVLGVSAAARIAAEGIVALCYAILIIATLVTIGRLRAAHAAAHNPAAPEPPRRAAIAVVLLTAWMIVALAVAAALIGYVQFALFLVSETVWIAVVAGAVTLLLAGIDDIATTVVASDSRLGRAAQAGVGIRASTIDQLGVLLSALLRLALVLVALGAVLMPFGSDAGSMLDRVRDASGGITVGEVTIAPGAILRALVVLLLTLAAMRAVGRWIETRYLPTTELDAGARNSVATIARYAGIILAVVWSLASLGIGMERIALVLSALSVGIGFGLQAITQNFVSGLILLAERPVKIGDLVRIGDQEGDVKRISVRATEITIADRSTLIVPNSELITKTIRNMTLADPLGRMQIQFAVPIATDVVRVREIVMAIYAGNPAVLADPAPVVFIDALSGGQVQFNSFAYVAGPRAAYSTRSALLFELLDRLRAAGVHLETPAQEVRIVRGEREGKDAG